MYDDRILVIPSDAFCVRSIIIIMGSLKKYENKI